MSDYVRLPRKLTAENGAKSLLIGEFYRSISVSCDVCEGDGCDMCNYTGHIAYSVEVSWSTIKEIYNKIVENLGEEISE